MVFVSIRWPFGAGGEKNMVGERYWLWLMCTETLCKWILFVCAFGLWRSHWIDVEKIAMYVMMYSTSATPQNYPSIGDGRVVKHKIIVVDIGKVTW